jgi:hypothetical protein
VVSVNPGRWAVADCGLKALGMDHGNPSLSDGSAVWYCSDEHIVFSPPDGGSLPEAGDQVRVLPAHMDPTVAYHERLYLVEGDRVLKAWPVDLRGLVSQRSPAQLAPAVAAARPCDEDQAAEHQFARPQPASRAVTNAGPIADRLRTALRASRRSRRLRAEPLPGSVAVVQFDGRPYGRKRLVPCPELRRSVSVHVQGPQLPGDVVCDAGSCSGRPAPPG